ncbi:MAG TPA: endonuclease V [Nitrososphaeraceae archaeon]|nr:endonuclease V [Nitrososphaeraceae archaeon]
MSKKSFTYFVNLQKEIAKKIIDYDCLNNEINNICGIDVAYKNNIAFCSALIVNKRTLEIIESINHKSIVNYPYIPGLLILRESESILSVLKLIKNSYDVLLIDAHGVLHPRKCGLACYIGVIIDKPTIGVAKKLLCGHIMKDNYIEYNGEILGYRIKKTNKKDIYVSIGHKIGLATATNIVMDLIKDNERLPEPLRLADINSKQYKSLNL